ncbi:MAG: non-homologous end-joining DNA ligase [Acidobacteriota bacterium]
MKKSAPKARLKPKRTTSATRPPRRPAKGANDAALASVRVSHPEKLYWPDEGYTKLDLLRFYKEAFPRLRPYVEDRLLSLERCPDGMSGPCFFQKEKPNGLPEDTPTQPIRHAKGVTNYVVGGRLETQLALANLGCIAVHVWGSRRQDPRKPDWVCFDLDPDSGKLVDAVDAALRVKEALDALNLVSFPKTSGGKGLHVFVPLRKGPDCDEALEFAEKLGAHLSAAYPKQLTMESRIANRKGRVYLDPFRNGFAQTVVSPYSVRRRPGAPFSTPLEWSEVTRKLDTNAFTLGTYEKRLAAGDPWEDFFARRQSLKDPLRAVRELRAS